MRLVIVSPSYMASEIFWSAGCLRNSLKNLKLDNIGKFFWKVPICFWICVPVVFLWPAFFSTTLSIVINSPVAYKLNSNALKNFVAVVYICQFFQKKFFQRIVWTDRHLSLNERDPVRPVQIVGLIWSYNHLIRKRDTCQRINAVRFQHTRRYPVFSTHIKSL